MLAESGREALAMSWLDSGDSWGRLLLQRGLGGIYLVAFLAAWHQFVPLLSSRGLLPIPEYLKKRRPQDSPSLFFWRYSDRLYQAVALTGAGLAAAALLGWLDGGPPLLSTLGWLAMWALYMSIVNVGQRWYGFGWESMLLEAGFLAAFLGSTSQRPSWVPLYALRWMLFRTELGAGLIKLRHDKCWRDLTCLEFHYETQPMPNPLSAHFHFLPRRVHRWSVVASHIIQVVVPFGLFLPQPVAGWAALALAAQQLTLIISGNYAWLNWLTLVLCFSALPGGPPAATGRPLWTDALLLGLAGSVIHLSRKPVENLLSERQAMNECYNPLRLINSYGAFGSVSRQRYEIVLQGAASEDGPWEDYEFLGKPGDVRRRPPQFAPYHLRLDWLIWFIPLGLRIAPTAHLHPEQQLSSSYELWFIRLIKKLHAHDPNLLRLLRHAPAETSYLRAVVFHYRYATPAERRAEGVWWVRRQVGIYLPPVSEAALAHHS